MTDRIPCEVPFCRRTAPADKIAPDTRIICRKHWQLGDERPRRLYTLAKRRFRQTAIERYLWLSHQAWDRVRRQAIERSAGVA